MICEADIYNYNQIFYYLKTKIYSRGEFLGWHKTAWKAICMTCQAFSDDVLSHMMTCQAVPPTSFYAPYTNTRATARSPGGPMPPVHKEFLQS